MAARAIWKGYLAFEDIEVPVKLYSAVEDRSVHFRLLHRKDKQPVKQKMVHPGTGKEVAADQIKKGVEVEKGVFVVLTSEEIEKAEPEESRKIAVERFVDPGVINHQWYDRPYYLGPQETDPAQFWALNQALQEENKEGLPRWVMRKRDYLGSLISLNGYLFLISLRFAEQVISGTDVQIPSQEKLNKNEVRMAQQLVSMLEADFDPSEYRNRYRERLLNLIETKARGGHIEVKRLERKPVKETSLEGVLQKSLAAAKDRKHA